MAINFDKAFGIHPMALSLHARRADILASNLANAETPNYKARDIDFESVLQERLGTSQKLQMNATNALHIGTNGPKGSAELLYRNPSAPSLDGNTVETNEEQAKFAENSLAYESSLRFVNGRITTLMTAIKGQ